MKQGWDIKSFSDCIEKVKATTKLQSSLYKDNGVYPIVSQEKELVSGYWDNKEDLFCHSTPLVVFGDHTMVVKYIDFDFVIGADGVKILMPKPFLLPKYFYYWVSSVRIQSRGYARHFRYLKETFVPIPSLSEQQRIVDILDAEFAKIDALKENAEKNLQNAKDLFQAVLRKELEPKEGWETKTIDKVVKSMFAGGDAPKENISKEPTEKYCIPIYANAVENDGLYGYTDQARVCEPSITVAARGSGTGYTLRRKDAYLPIVRLIVIIPNSDMVLLDYIYYSLRSLKIDVSGVAIPQLTVPMLKKHKVNYPLLLKEQQRIVSTLDGISIKCTEIENNYKRTILLCTDLKQALLRKAFNGEL